MRINLHAILAWVCLLPGSVLGSDRGALVSPVDPDGARELTSSVSRQPLRFQQNLGQWPDSILFKADAAGSTLWITQTGFTYQFTRNVDPQESPQGVEPTGPLSFKTEQLYVQAVFAGGRRMVGAVGQDELAYKCNYLLGNDPAQWRTDVPSFNSILVREAYPGIDIRFTGDANRQVQCEFVVAPGAKVDQIEMTYVGVDRTSVDAEGRLILDTKWGRLSGVLDARQRASNTASPRWQSRAGDAFGVESATEQLNSFQSLSVGLSFSTYLGGTDVDEGRAIVHDESGNVYVTGTTYSAAFPVQDPYQTKQASADVFVTKLSNTGNALLYSTFIGGNDDDYGSSLALDSSGNVYVTGATYSTNFPTLNPYQTDQGDLDLFVVKLLAAGNNIGLGTYLGGSGSDYAHSIAVDGDGSAFVTGYTFSEDFPTEGPIQTNQGGIDAFIAKLTPSGSGLVYSTYLGGSADDYGRAVALNDSGYAYLTGTSFSSDFPTQDPYLTAQGGSDVFLAILTPSGDSLEYSTHLGGSDDDYPRGLALDHSGCVYLTGATQSDDFPILNPYQTDPPGDDAFVTKFVSSGASLAYSTYLGGNAFEIGWSIDVDDSGHAYVTGLTQSSDFPTQDEYQTDQPGDDAFVSKLSSDGGSLVYSTILGGSGSDIGYGISVDARGSAYVTGTAEADFPTLNPFQTAQAGRDVFVTKLTPFPDTDDDGVDDQFDNCPLVSNPGQENSDSDFDAMGDACDICTGGDDALDADGDSIPDFCDACPGFDDALDADADTVPDGCDTCPADTLNDVDGDGVCGSVDNCPAVANADQLNYDGDSEGDACDTDDDDDGILDASDNCPFVANADQLDNDGDSEGDACDPDDDNDTIPDSSDNCLFAANANQMDYDGDSAGDACDSDDDNDEVPDSTDNCPLGANADQLDNDGDLAGDACDPDDDNDTVPDTTDNCPVLANADQADNDGDLAGDACDPDDDNDTVPDTTDNCPLVMGSQTNNDGDAEGDVCDPDDDNDEVSDVTDNCPLLANSSQEDTDDDGLGNPCDNCPTLPNPDQEDSDQNGVGDECTCPIGVTGDVNQSGGLTSADIILTVNFVFKSGASPLPCDGAADANCSGGVNASDIIGMVNHVFKSGPAPCDACTLFPDTWRCDVTP